MSIILTKADGTTDVTYAQTQNNGMQVVYQNMSAGLVEPENLRIQHWLRPVGQSGTDRHQVVLQKVIVEDSTNKTLVGTVALDIRIPRSTEFTVAMLKDMIAQLTCLVNRTSSVTTLFNGGTPDGDLHHDGAFAPAF